MTVPNTPGSFPVPDSTGQYRMGPLFTESPAVDYWWNYQWDDGTYTACGEPEGWESTIYITPMDQVGGRDGALLGPQSVAPRDLDCEALIVAPTAALLRQHLARIRAVLGPQSLPGPRQPVIWEAYDFGTDRRLALITRPQGRASMVVVPGGVEGGLAAVVRFTLVAANPPWKYQSGAAETASVGLADTSLIAGRTYSKTYSYNYGVALPIGGEIIVETTGDLPSSVVFTITGPVDFPIITNVTTGQSFQVNLNIPAGTTVTIDGNTGVVTPGSVRLIGRPWVLAPGQNTIRWRSASGTYYPAALLRLDWRSTSR